MRKVKALQDFEKMKRIATEYARKKQWNKALKTVYFTSGFMFNLNSKMVDQELESLVEQIAKTNVILPEDYAKDENRIVYYDSFGQAKRGLTQIYLKALHQLGYRIIYITYAAHSRVKTDVLSYVKEEDIYFISQTMPLAQIEELSEILQKTKAGSAFLYLLPEDVTAVGAFSLFAGKIKRYQINLTDHAFWLGCNISDVVINFREFGAKAAVLYRGIEEEKNVYLPYYPGEVSKEFLGLDFLDNTKPFIFSGGNLYKTLSSEGTYYTLIRRILNTYDVNFVYFGDGDAKAMMKLCKEYPGRVIFSRERNDFFEVLKRSVLYVSTHPYNGGLMTQYALLAQKVPVTLCEKGVEPELTIRHEETFWNYNTMEEVIDEIGRLLKETDYRRQQESCLLNYIIDDKQFAKELEYILKTGCGMRKVEIVPTDITGVMDHPAWYYQGLRYDRLFFRKGGLFFLQHFPVKFLKGAAGRVLERIYNGR